MSLLVVIWQALSPKTADVFLRVNRGVASFEESL